ncbi:MAG: SusD/RagB family nutrient-binding outer membrane lipoprotein [Salinivirgaceae bacterium]|nr:MAG: SusD/RagB family nutrient-binding outer membrane lipoprotein [Salinivirgaceae bacterium]
MKKIFQNILSITIVGLLLTSACTDDWEELNTDPNNPTVVPATNLLAQSIRYFGDTYYDAWFNMNNTSTYAGHLGKIQYIDESRYYERESVIDDNWRDLYRVAIDLEMAKKFARSEGNTNLEAAALTFQSFVLQIGTDSWGGMPFTQAISGLTGITSPAYDNQETIYLALMDSLNKANTLFALGELSVLGDGDILYGGDVAKWQKFANSVRLRMANRAAGVSTAAATVRTEILADANTYPIMASNDDNAFLYWPGAAPYKEPWAEDAETRDDHAVGSYLIDYMLSTADPRIAVYAEPAASDGAYRGVVPGIDDESLGSIAQYSRIGSFYRGNAEGHTPFMRYAEVKFIEAEANSDQVAFEAAIVASFEENELDAGDGAAFAAGFSVNSDDLYYQKWVALFKQGHEAWAECRRTDVPVMGVAPGARFPEHNRPPFRFPYPTGETQLNSNNLAPFSSVVVDKFWGEQMWWDTRTGVN